MVVMFKKDKTQVKHNLPCIALRMSGHKKFLKLHSTEREKNTSTYTATYTMTNGCEQ